MPLRRRSKIIVTFLGLALLVVLLGAVFIWHSEAKDSDALITTPVVITPERIAQGKALAIASDCVACHSTTGSKPFAGGLPMPLPMGNIYSTNITPDKEHGIGQYSLQEFQRAVQYGIRRDGGNLYPAMPYTAYAKLTPDDIQSLYAYFMQGVPAVAQENRKPDFPWPLTLRFPLKVWNQLFLSKGVYQNKPEQSAEWNRGAYLVQGAAHCGTCHTPRGLAMQEKAYDETNKHYLAGAALGGWQAYNITSDPHSGIGTWTKAEIVQYLRTGNVPNKAQAAGGMAEAITHSFSKMSDQDLQAMATYLVTVPAYQDQQTAARSSFGKPTTDYQDVRFAAQGGKAAPTGAELYLNHCASCHGKTGVGTPDGYYPSMVHNSVLGAKDAHNLIQVMLNGAEVENGKDHYFMPSFAGELNDEELATLANYVTVTFGHGAGTVSAHDVKKLRPAH